MDSNEEIKLNDANSIKYFYELPATTLKIEDIINGTIQVPYIRIKIPKLQGMVALNVAGESMSPTVNSGNIVIFDKTPIETIISGELYLVFTKDGQRMIKRLVNQKNEHDKPCLICLSDNPNKNLYADFIIEQDKIQVIYRINGLISYL